MELFMLSGVGGITGMVAVVVVSPFKTFASTTMPVAVDTSWGVKWRSWCARWREIYTDVFVLLSAGFPFSCLAAAGGGTIGAATGCCFAACLPFSCLPLVAAAACRSSPSWT
uniref:Uncharacterized protein n=1 Tax=Anopheles coluzzii TaxID=1518534 RepID=A0A8W7P8C2_ANOCL